MLGGAERLRGRFELIEEIGEGGFARVYRARETTTGQKVALKVLKDAFRTDKEVIERFRREVFAVASISNPHVVALRDFGISGDEFFIAMEFVEGPTLRDVLDQYVWGARDIHVVIGQIAEALSAAHRQNIVHRDLKPENVMLVPGEDGSRQVKVLDFGLAKLAELERNLGLAPLTRVGMCFGTPQYMSPELIYGKPVDPSCDLFALGVIAYEMLAGLRPWDGSSPQEVMLAVVKQPLPRIMKLEDAGDRIEQVNQFFQRALAKEKKDRPPDASSFFREFQHALFGHQRSSENMSATSDGPLHVFDEVSRAQIRLPETHPGETGTLAGHRPAMTGELSAFPHDTTEIDHNTMGSETAAGPDFANMATGPRLVSLRSQRGARLSSKWLESIPSITPLPASAAAPTAQSPLKPISDPPTSALARTGPARTRSPRPVQGWVMGLLIVFFTVLMIGAAAVGFYIGRGR
jgi:serine/threonine protein kinase